MLQNIKWKFDPVFNRLPTFLQITEPPLAVETTTHSFQVGFRVKIQRGKMPFPSEKESPVSLQDPEWSQHWRLHLEDFNLRKMVSYITCCGDICFWSRLSLSQILCIYKSNWLINSQRILLFLYNILRKMDGFYYSAYYFLSAKVKKKSVFTHLS